MGAAFVVPRENTLADYSGEAPTSAGTALTERNGAAQGVDTVPAGALVIARNTGAGSHTVVFAVGFTVDGLTVTNRTVTVPAGAVRGIRVPLTYADANGRVPVHVGEGTQSEVKLLVVGA